MNQSRPFIIKSQRNFFTLIFLLCALSLVGCATGQSDLHQINLQQAATIGSLQNEINRLNSELDEMVNSQEELELAKLELEEQLKTEIQSGDMALSMEDRGLVLTVLSRVLFDSGRADLKGSSEMALDKIAQTLQEKVGSNMIYVEGHTDNEPILKSNWRSNWELSTARATEVVHHFIQARNLEPTRLAATGYGEFQPVDDNSTEAGRMRNRRVEIIISPKKMADVGPMTFN